MIITNPAEIRIILGEKTLNDLDNLPEHLGGHMNKVHTDRGPLKIMMKEYNCKSLLDIGCGPGWQVDVAKDLGYQSYGIDGDWTVLPKKPNFWLHDFTEGPVEHEANERYDLAWSVEFLEHIEEQYLPNVMESFRLCKYAIVTHAVPGQNGHHHVNLQEKQYWVDKFGEYDMLINEELTTKVKEASLMHKPFIKRTGLVFVNEKY